jgi:hypothetical protein
MTIRTETAKRHITKMGFKAFSHGEGDVIKVSAEYGDDAADYYGEFRGGYPWINPKLEAFAEKHGCYWEWENAGCIGMYPI